MCIMRMELLAKNSKIKSRSDTASSELLYGLAKPMRSAVSSRSMGKVVPARAAAPRELLRYRSVWGLRTLKSGGFTLRRLPR